MQLPAINCKEQLLLSFAQRIFSLYLNNVAVVGVKIGTEARTEEPLEGGYLNSRLVG